MPETQSKIILVVFISTMVILFAIALFVFLVVHSRKKYNQYSYEKELLQQQFAQTLLQTQLEIKQQTMEYISRELHDNLSQVASLIKINLNTLRLEAGSPHTEKVEDSKVLLRRLINDIKLLSRSLHSDDFSHTGLFKSIETDILRINRDDLVVARFMLDGAIAEPPYEAALILYRMAQEILNNIVKHAQATEVQCKIGGSENTLILAFKDNGVGFDPEEKRKSGGAGLQNLEKRAALINAQLNIHSKPGDGTTVTITASIK
jgi:signal transduction histidine kinase